MRLEEETKKEKKEKQENMRSKRKRKRKISSVLLALLLSVSLCVLVELGDGREHAIRERNLDAPADWEPAPSGSFKGYVTYDELVEMYPKIVARFGKYASGPHTLGQSLLGKSIHGICVGAGCNCKQGSSSECGTPQALFTGMHHAREPMTLMVILYTLNHLGNMFAAGDVATQSLLQSRQMWFVPLVNPDGYERNRKKHPNGGGMQRKNERQGCGKADDMGVDLNRNYDACWAGDTCRMIPGWGRDCGSSERKCDEDYRGSAAFSEPETQAIRDLVLGNNFSVALNFHSFGSNIYMPYSCLKLHKMQSRASSSTLERIGKEISRISHYKLTHVWAGSSVGGLGYSAAGDTSDWMLLRAGIAAFTPEVGPPDSELDAKGKGDSYGFWPPKDRIPVHANASTISNIHAAWLAGPLYDVTATLEGASMYFMLSNVGLRASHRALKVAIATPSNAGTSINIVATADIQPPLPGDDAERVSFPQKTYSRAEPPHLLVGDNVSCALYRGTFGGSGKWSRMHLRRCDACSVMFADKKEAPSDASHDTTPSNTGGSDGGRGGSPSTMISPSSALPSAPSLAIEPVTSPSTAVATQPSPHASAPASQTPVAIVNPANPCSNEGPGACAESRTDFEWKSMWVYMTASLLALIAIVTAMLWCMFGRILGLRRAEYLPVKAESEEDADSGHTDKGHAVVELRRV